MYTNIYTILIVTFTIIFIIGFCLIIKFILNTIKNKAQNKILYTTALVFITIGTIGEIISNCLYENAVNEKYQIDIQNALQNGYTVYVDGSETDTQYINIENYNIQSIQVDEDTKEIHISTSSHHNWRKFYTKI